MEDFQYLRPATVTEAVLLLAQHKGKARLIAGGQSLIPMLRSRLVRPAYIISLEAIAELKRIEPSDGGLRVGAMATHYEVVTSPLVKERAAILCEAEALVGSPAVRNLGTLGGNLCHNEVGADPPPALLALGATAVIVSPHGERRLPLESFFKGFLETALGEDEILAYIDIPALPSGAIWSYMKCRLRAVDKAIVGVGVVMSMEGRLCREARVALGGVAPVPFRAKRAEAALIGQHPGDRIIEEAAMAAVAEAQPMSDAHASADYRRKMAAVFTRRALRQALETGG
ncbi:MAG: xanthine dehydrogenase family protein subunit M [Deltaproteobacteria bacterium]|nr:xanthine dehydrogenase family protein subunit M [Deltaproteobacteria bacterium]